jgi:D-arabinose 1-dehydrogenase-like Zn-dependent alcohol dehydrogenase
MSLMANSYTRGFRSFRAVRSSVVSSRYPLGGERVVRSVANLTRRDGIELMELAARVPLEITVETSSLYEANVALERLRAGRLTGAAVRVAGGGSAEVRGGR